jgi:protein-S-isoprenylcysteine O-methyltransferase Ste14
MYFFVYVVLIAWGIVLFYWVKNWKNVKPTVDKPRSKIRIPDIGIFFIVLALLATKIINIIQYYPSRDIHLSLTIAGTAMVLVGLVISILGRKALADNWCLTIDLKKGHKLITTGIYRYVRHPIYSGLTFMGVGTVLVSQQLAVVAILLVALVIFVFRIKKEERLMMNVFSEEYQEYRKKVKAIIPFLL